MSRLLTVLAPFHNLYHPGAPAAAKVPAIARKFVSEKHLMNHEVKLRQSETNSTQIVMLDCPSFACRHAFEQLY